jgi:hypothetical protein
LLVIEVSWADNGRAPTPLADERTAVLHHAVAELKVEFHEPLPEVLLDSASEPSGEHADVNVYIH